MIKGHQSKTARVRRSLYSRLEAAGFDLRTISQEDYTEVKRRLRWRESTFKTALKFLGKPHSHLFEGFREYVPTDREQEMVEQGLGDFGVLLCFFGRRFSEIWSLHYSNDTVDTIRFRTNKNGRDTTFRLNSLPDRVVQAANAWIKTGKHSVTPRQVRYQWSLLQAAGELSQECIPHSFRHRVISRLVSNGLSLPEVAEIVGHKDISTTYRYFHQSPTRKAEALAGVYNG